MSQCVPNWDLEETTNSGRLPLPRQPNADSTAPEPEETMQAFPRPHLLCFTHVILLHRPSLRLPPSSLSRLLAVVIMPDRMAVGLQSRCATFSSATTPAAWGKPWRSMLPAADQPTIVRPFPKVNVPTSSRLMLPTATVSTPSSSPTSLPSLSSPSLLLLSNRYHVITYCASSLEMQTN